MSGLAIAFLLMDTIMKLLALPIVLESSGPLGFQGAAMARGLGLLLLACTVLYLLPRTTVLFFQHVETGSRTVAVTVRVAPAALAHIDIIIHRSRSRTSTHGQAAPASSSRLRIRRYRSSISSHRYSDPASASIWARPWSIIT